MWYLAQHVGVTVVTVVHQGQKLVQHMMFMDFVVCGPGLENANVFVDFACCCCCFTTWVTKRMFF